MYLELIHEELGVVDQHPENVEGEKISKVEEELKMPKESKISYNEDAEVEAPLIPHTLPTLGNIHIYFPLYIIYVYVFE